MGKKKEEKELQEMFDSFGADPEVLREWDLAIEKIKAVRGVLRIKAPGGYRALKKVSATESRVRFVQQAVDHLAGRGFPNVPRFIRTKYGDPYVVHPTGIYYLTDWMPGKEADLKKAKNVFLAAETLAKLHSAGAGFEADGFGQETREDFSAQWGRFQAKLQSYDTSLADRREQNAMEDAYRTHRSELNKMIHHAAEQLAHSPYGQILEWARDNKTICHGSYSRQNLIVDKERMSVVDFDHCHYGHPVHDLGALLTRYMPRYEWDAAIGFSILDVYRAVREVTAEEMTVLAAYLSFPQRTLDVVEAYFERTRDWDAGKFANRFRKQLALDEGREMFVQDLIARYGLNLTAPSFAPHLEALEEYDDLESMESSSVETRDDSWEAREHRAVDRSEQVSVQVEEETPDVALVSHGDEYEEEREDGESRSEPPVRYTMPRAKQPRKPQKPGPWRPRY
ncbi:CotS family spore coat protein [Tumebacillus sp. BK434]|uniref:CotS family spore coat protein n=1 Tax=Tumebacillus sp. BK434 TaxID=2512169 RepID=UPI00104EB7C8|nr:CotS family spore coat protein [Tumebacillus sp. BK434]TCP54791.1 CotS family spore coat protein [Tumebacillus sp. BK434]